uniref:Uncharacterized protein n=1 Tax=Globodera rostochiensis TaxID=31243 RepID=A0A914HWA8_GLORO
MGIGPSDRKEWCGPTKSWQNAMFPTHHRIALLPPFCLLRPTKQTPATTTVPPRFSPIFQPRMQTYTCCACMYTGFGLSSH